MSRQVYGLKQTVTGTRTLHFVARGDNTCAICQRDRRQMQFFFTSNRDVFNGVLKMPHQRLIDDCYEVAQYVACKGT